MSREAPRYETGSDYEAAGEEAEDDEAANDAADAAGDEDFAEPKSDEEFLGDEALPSSFSQDRDIYGEDDLPPEDDEFAPVNDGGMGARVDSTQIGRPQSTPQRTGETKAAPAMDMADVDELPPDSPDATRAGPPHKLEAIAGPDLGKVRQIRGVRMVIGRTAGCDWKLSDPSASRKHCELVVGDGGVLLRDLGSGNGTKVNGQKVAEHKLEHGDEIAIGKTVIRFIDEIAAFRKARDEEEAKGKEEEKAAAAKEQADSPPVDPQRNVSTHAQGMKAMPRRHTDKVEGAPPRTAAQELLQKWHALQDLHRYLIMAGAGVLVLLLIVAIASSGSSPEPVVKKDPKIAKAAAMMTKAQKLAKDGKYDEAARLAAEADKLVPGSDGDGLAERAKQESQARTQLEEAKKLFAENRFDEAKVALSRASFITEKGAEEKKKLQAEVEAGLQDWLKGQAETALRLRDIESARGIIGRLPPAMQRVFEPKIVAIEEQLAAEAAAEERQGKKTASNKKKAQVTQRKEYVERAFDPVARKFAAGEFQRAALECDRVADQFRSDDSIRARANELKRLIPAFARAFEEGQRKYKAGSLEAAARPLKKARELYLQLGFEGSLGKVIDEELASAALTAAGSSYAREDFASAVQYYKETLKLAPNEERARDGLAKVTKRVEELYLQAYMIRDREPKEAISKLKVVLSVSEGTPLHQKARELLSSLQ